MGKDCRSTDPKHYYDFIHFDHPKSDDMIRKYEKILKKQKCQQIYDEHTKTKSSSSATSNEFGQFLTDEELAQFSTNIYPHIHILYHILSHKLYIY